MSLSANGPARWEGLRAFFAMRAIPGLESTSDQGFRRNVPGGWIELRQGADASQLDLTHELDGRTDLDAVVATVRRVADLDTDLQPIGEHLAEDPVLAERLRVADLGRRPGAFDRFEVAVRAVVGQQVSVAGATTLLGRLLVEANGRTNEQATADGQPHFERFPPPEVVAECPLDLGMPQRRRDTIRALARAVADGRVTLDPALGTAAVTEQLLALPGIGPWTAGYVAMRCLDDPDGWPVGDLGLRRSLGLETAELERRSERWRPWRAYAALLLWKTDPIARERKERR